MDEGLRMPGRYLWELENYAGVELRAPDLERPRVGIQPWIALALQYYYDYYD